ncbi:MAG TPA: helix-turn-helix transcriptional regulator [Puia sp.]|jgi:transcriptional regulator with XRE-family HTH domain|nr:helix-turn-helix transcriptional regulator [Puia sp.]
MDQKDEVLKKFGRYLTALREERKLTVQELASAAGLTSQQLRRIEAGEVDILFTTVVMLSRGLDITPGELLQSLDPD